MQTLTERKGTRTFVKVSRWNKLSDMTITRNSMNAKYVTDVNKNSDKLFLTYFRIDNAMYPIGRFEKLSTPIMLNDLTRLVMKDTESNLWLEINETKDKVRAYQEIE